MAEFKSSFIGGYSKKSVNEYVSKLENENDILKKALDLAEHNALKADKYYNENTKLNNEIAQLNEVVAELNKKLAETEKSNNDYISSIGQIFYSAYESGAKITDDATAGSQEFLQKIEEVSAEAKAEAQKALTAYNLINTDINGLNSANQDCKCRQGTGSCRGIQGLFRFVPNRNQEQGNQNRSYRSACCSKSRACATDCSRNRTVTAYRRSTSTRCSCR